MSSGGTEDPAPDASSALEAADESPGTFRLLAAHPAPAFLYAFTKPRLITQDGQKLPMTWGENTLPRSVVGNTGFRIEVPYLGMRVGRVTSHVPPPPEPAVLKYRAPWVLGTGGSLGEDPRSNGLGLLVLLLLFVLALPAALVVTAGLVGSEAGGTGQASRSDSNPITEHGCLPATGVSDILGAEMKLYTADKMGGTDAFNCEYRTVGGGDTNTASYEFMYGDDAQGNLEGCVNHWVDLEGGPMESQDPGDFDALATRDRNYEGDASDSGVYHDVVAYAGNVCLIGGVDDSVASNSHVLVALTERAMPTAAEAKKFGEEKCDTDCLFEGKLRRDQ